MGAFVQELPEVAEWYGRLGGPVKLLAGGRRGASGVR